MALPWDALITPLSKDDIEGTMLDLIATLGIPVTNWKKSGTARTIIAVVATVIAGLTAIIAIPIRGMVLETSTGLWLTILAKYVYGVDRVQGTFAETDVDLVNTQGGVYEYSAGEIVFLNTASGKTYVNTGSISLGAFETLNGVPVRAVEVGSASNAGTGDIDDLVTPMLGVTVSNPSAALGQDEQDDVSLRADCADARGALSPLGAKGAYSFFAKRTASKAALTRADGTAIGVNRVQVKVQNLGGAVTVYVATPSGDVSGSASTPGDDLYIVAENIQALAVPYGITCTVTNSTGLDWSVLYSVTADADAGKTAAEIKARIDAALIGFFATFPIGGATKNGVDYYCFLSKTRAIIESADDAIIDCVVVQPLADMAMEKGDRVNLIIAIGSSVSLVSQPS